uniref:Uncharacterized protein n=1 Tax=Anopheles albimanus TaxID=7167 RepID=A0A182F338_ANOAL
MQILHVAAAMSREPVQPAQTIKNGHRSVFMEWNVIMFRAYT